MLIPFLDTLLIGTLMSCLLFSEEGSPILRICILIILHDGRFEFSEAKTSGFLRLSLSEKIGTFLLDRLLCQLMPEGLTKVLHLFLSEEVGG